MSRGEAEETGGEADRSAAVRIGIIALLVVAYGVLGAYFHLALRIGIVYSHFAYIPIVLASMWWGRKGLVAAALVAGVTLFFHLLGLANAALWSDGARVLLFLAVAVAVGELSRKVKAAQEALRVSGEKHRLIVEKSLAGILVYREGTILFANPRLGQMLGHAPDRMVGSSVWALFADEDLPRVRALVEQRKAGGPPDLYYECRLVRADGTAIWADVASSAASFEGEPAVLVNAYDITARKEAEAKRLELTELARRQEEQLVHSSRLAEMGEMSAAVAHDLNQPLTGIRNFAKNALYMLEQEAGSLEDVTDNLRLIVEQVDRAAKIIDQMRSITRKSERQLAPVDLNAIIREGIEFLMPQMRLTGVETRLELADELPSVLADRTRLEQVFLNLLTNARQAMEDSGERRLTVRSRVVGGKRLPVVVEVEDTGKGFPPGEAAKLFAPFYSTKEPGRGTGLGLTISHRIIKEHGGTIQAEGEPGTGARFTLRLPLASSEQVDQAASAHAKG